MLKISNAFNEAKLNNIRLFTSKGCPMNDNLTKVSDLRKEYNLNELLEENISSDPIVQFTKWFDEALAGNIYEPNAMILSTTIRNQPRSRVVLLKGLSEGGFEFYTNYTSDKGQEIKTNNNVSLLFYWDRLQRQVRIEGIVEQLPAAISDVYFNSRPRGSQLGAWVSDQSSVIGNREVLEKKQEQLLVQYGEDKAIPRPVHWGGYVVKPQLIEFWQGRASRLHDRLQYTYKDENWQITRLSP